jgi:hypothetical protein
VQEHGDSECASGADHCCPIPGGDATCVDLRSNPDHCGACGHPCQLTEVCTAGVCGCSDPNATDCSGTCVSLQIDRHNCGSCGVACGIDEVCQNGLCAPNPICTFPTLPGCGVVGCCQEPYGNGVREFVCCGIVRTLVTRYCFSECVGVPCPPYTCPDGGSVLIGPRGCADCASIPWVDTCITSSNGGSCEAFIEGRVCKFDPTVGNTICQ